MMSNPETGSTKPKGNRTRAWAVTFVVFLAGFAMPANMGKVMWLAPLILPVFQIDEGMLGWLIGVFYLLGAIVAFPAASFIRKIGNRATIVIALICAIAGGLLGCFAADVATLMVSRVIEGAGFGLMGVAGVATIAPWFPVNKRGVPLGIWAAWIALANALTPMIDAWIAEAAGSYIPVWYFWVAADAVILLIFLVVYRTPTDPYIDEEEKAGDETFSYKAIFQNKAVVALAVTFFFGEGAFIATQGFLTNYVTTYLDASLTTGTLIVSLSAFGGVLMNPIVGKISDKINSRYKVMVVCIACAVVYSIFVFWATELWQYIPIVIIQCVVGATPAMLWASSTEVVPSKLISGATAALAFTQSVGMFLGSMLFGQVIVAMGGSYTYAAWIVIVPCWVLSFLVTIVMLRKRLR
jgi:predicted MFS family arabinose efflux permease